MDQAPTPGQALKGFRLARGMSRKQLASEVSVTRMAIWRWEADERKIDDDKLLRVVEVTGIPATVLRPDLARLMAAE